MSDPTLSDIIFSDKITWPEPSLKVHENFEKNVILMKIFKIPWFRNARKIPFIIKKVISLRQVSGIDYLIKMSAYRLACRDSKITWVG